MKETELAAHIVDWLDEQHFEVYQEVQIYAYDKIADIVAVRSGIVWIIECKTTLTFKVIDQARCWPVHYRSIAVPALQRTRTRNKNRNFAYLVARKFDVGVIEFSNWFEPKIKIVEPAPLMREHHWGSKDLLGKLTKKHKTFAQAGNSKGNYLTPYKITMQNVRRIITSNPGCTLKFIMDTIGDHHYANDRSARQTIRNALIEWETWCRVDISAREHKYYLKEDENV